MESSPYDAFVEASVWGDSLETAQAILAAHPEIATRDVYAAAILGDVTAVRGFVANDPAHATAPGGPRGWDALTYLCFSLYLRLDTERAAGFVQTAMSLLDAGTVATTGFWKTRDGHEPEWESALYGAAGVAHNPEMTRLLLERGADPNDDETPYHAPETVDNRALHVLVESGKVSADSLATMLLRKHDWHDHDGIKWLLEHGADPNRMTRWGRAALHQAILRDNAIEVFQLLLDHEADPTLLADGKSAVAMAARRGRGDLLELFERRGFAAELDGVDRFLAAIARNDAKSAQVTAAREPLVVTAILAQGGRVLAEFAGVGNTDGVRHLLDLGVGVAAKFRTGDDYWDVATDSTALHVAAWRARHATVKLLIERGAPVDVPDGKGRTPLALAVRACVDSYWTERRSPDSAEALLRAGASASSVDFPSGYLEVDKLLSRYGKRGLSRAADKIEDQN